MYLFSNLYLSLYIFFFFYFSFVFSYSRSLSNTLRIVRVLDVWHRTLRINCTEILVHLFRNAREHGIGNAAFQFWVFVVVAFVFISLNYAWLSMVQYKSLAVDLLCFVNFSFFQNTQRIFMHSTLSLSLCVVFMYLYIFR